MNQLQLNATARTVILRGALAIFLAVCSGPGESGAYAAAPGNGVGQGASAGTGNRSTNSRPAEPAVLAADPFADPVNAPVPTLSRDSSPTTAPATVDATLTNGSSHSTGQSVTATQVMVSDSGTVEIHVNDANLLEVLRMLSLQSQKNIIASKEVNGSVTANLYNVTVREALDAILKTSGYVYREKGNFIYITTAKEQADMERAQRQLSTQVFHLYYTPAANAMNMIKPVLSPEAQVAMTAAASSGIDTNGTGGGGGASSDTGGNSHAGGDMLVVTDYTENLERIRKVLKEVDHRPQQILVEATILSATLIDNNSLGVDFSVMGGVKFNQIVGTPTQTVSAAAGGNLQKANDPKTGVSGYGIGETSFTNQLPAGGMRVGLLTNNISVFIQALEAVTNTTVLANPKVLALDKQKGYVHVGRSDGYQTTTVSQTTSTQTVQFLDSGTTLSFRPYVGDDGYIRMEIHPEDSSGGLTSANLPFKTTTEVTTNMMVQDGHTVVIGGLFRETSQTSRSQVPGLGNIPLLGMLFRQQQDQSRREEIIILLTPHIIKDQSAYAAVSAEELKRIDEYRVGVRTGMMLFGRERLAETAYENARKELARPRPDRDLALWHLDCAIDLNPMFLEAIELKEKLTGQQMKSVDNSSMRSFMTRVILADRQTLIPTTAPSSAAPTTAPSTTAISN